jgi:predicted MPP superfamily phosphohydrolase
MGMESPLPYPRSRLRRRVLHALLLISLLCVLYGVFVETQWVEVTRVTVHLPRLPAELDGLRVVQMSDLHYNTRWSERAIRRAVRLAAREQPDLVVFTGDYVTHSSRGAEPCARVLGQLRAPLGAYAVLGNHDYWGRKSDVVADALTSHGIRVLANESAPITVNGKTLWIVGVDDYWSRNMDHRAALGGLPEDDAKIVLLHEPDFAGLTAQYAVDLQLSGHSHGGQGRLPWIGALHYPPFAGGYPEGLRRVGAMQVYTNRGIGTVGLPLRFLCRPEVTVFTLRCARHSR